MIKISFCRRHLQERKYCPYHFLQLCNRLEKEKYVDLDWGLLRLSHSYNKLTLSGVRKDLTEFIRECIMTIGREKENGTLTDEAGREIIEFLDMTCSYLLKNEPELKKEVRRVMRPIVMSQTERIEIVTERYMNAIRKSIQKYYASGPSPQEAKASIQDIFSLDETEAEEKMEKYWFPADE